MHDISRISRQLQFLLAVFFSNPGSIILPIQNRRVIAKNQLQAWRCIIGPTRESSSGKECKDCFMSGHSPREVTQPLKARRGGDQAALNKLIPLIHDKLRGPPHVYTLREMRSGGEA